MGFLVLRFWLFLDRFFGFCAKNFDFSVLVFIAICAYSVFQHLVFGFREKYSWVFGFDIRYGFRFSYLTYLVSGFSSILVAITRLRLSLIAAKRKCYREECVTNQMKYRRNP